MDSALLNYKSRIISCKSRPRRYANSLSGWAKDWQLAAHQREIDELKRKDASINTLSERLTVLEQQARTATPQGLHSLTSK